MDLPGHGGKVKSGKKIILFLIKGIRVDIEIIATIFSDI